MFKSGHAVLYFLCLAVFIGCKSDPCEETPCYEGECLDGTCICDPGYEGSDCSIKMVTKFVGSWAATDDCDNDLNNYTAIISASSQTVDQLILTNMAGLGSLNTVVAVLNTSTSAVIASQDGGNGTLVSGTGTISTGATQITWIYELKFLPDSIVNCTATWNLQ